MSTSGAGYQFSSDITCKASPHEACDGFNITPTHLPGGCEDFVAMITPELQRRGLFRKEYEGRTLRENLGLERPVNRYAAARTT